MALPSKKNYGNFTPVKGDIVLVWGQSQNLFKVMGPDHEDDPPGAALRLQSIYHWSIVAHATDLRRATPEEAARYKTLKAECTKEHKAQQAVLKAREQAEKDELSALGELCNADPRTHLDGEVWARVRALSPGALSWFVNKGFRVPK